LEPIQEIYYRASRTESASIGGKHLQMPHRRAHDGVEMEGRRTDEGGQELGTKSNVVPFPRDWLGPREELIPFGPSAGDKPRVPPAADAFWGEDSGAIHAVLPGPGAVAAPIARGSLIGPRRLSAARIGACGLVVVVCAAALVGKLGGLPGGHSPSVSSSTALAGFMDLAQLRGAVGVPQVAVPKHVSAGKPVRSQPRRVVHRSPQRSSTRPAVTRSTTAATSVPAPSESTAQPVSSSSPSHSTATSSQPAHSTVSSGHAADVRPGPVGPGAAFGPGQLK
jgi:hypothetical protein